MVISLIFRMLLCTILYQSSVEHVTSQLLGNDVSAALPFRRTDSSNNNAKTMVRISQDKRHNKRWSMVAGIWRKKPSVLTRRRRWKKCAYAIWWWWWRRIRVRWSLIYFGKNARSREKFASLCAYSESKLYDYHVRLLLLRIISYQPFLPQSCPARSGNWRSGGIGWKKRAEPICCFCADVVRMCLCGREEEWERCRWRKRERKGAHFSRATYFQMI